MHQWLYDPYSTVHLSKKGFPIIYSGCTEALLSFRTTEQYHGDDKDLIDGLLVIKLIIPHPDPGYPGQHARRIYYALIQTG